MWPPMTVPKNSPGTQGSRFSDRTHRRGDHLSRECAGGVAGTAQRVEPAGLDHGVGGQERVRPNLVEFERRGYAVRPLPDGDLNGHIDLDALENMLQFEQPDFIHICHIGSMSGVVQPVARIVEIAHAAQVPVVVDMAQSVGHVPTVTGATSSTAPAASG